MKEQTNALTVHVPSDVYLKFKIALVTEQITAKELINKFVLDYLENKNV